MLLQALMKDARQGLSAASPRLPVQAWSGFWL